MLKLSDSIGKYKVTKEINIGGFCNSYFVSDSKGTYFLKEYTEPKESDDFFESFYNNQCTIIDRLNSMGSIAEKYVDHFINEGIYYQVKEKLDGINLEEYLQTHEEYEDRKFLSIILCGIVRNLHGQKIVHQDLKPAQIMLVDDETGKKTKLGYRLILSDFDWSIPDSNVVQIVGTIYYKSPEHYKNITPSEESDIYTVGIMIYEFLTGQNPFDFDDTPTDEELSKRVLNKKIFDEPKNLNDEIPDTINEIILRCLEVNPSDRPSLEEIQRTLLEENKEKVSEGLANQFYIKHSSESMLIYNSKDIGRTDLKLFFRNVMDDAGNQIYKYCDSESPMFFVEKQPSGQFTIYNNISTKNYFLLNGTKINDEKVTLKDGDKLSLYSSSKSKNIAEFTISGVK